MPEVPGVNAKIGGDISGYVAAMRAGSDSTRELKDRVGELVNYLGQLGGATDEEREKLTALAMAALQAEGATSSWSEAQQRAAMAMSGAHDQALKMNEALDESQNIGGAFAEEMLNMVGAGAALGGGLALVVEGLRLLKEATVGSITDLVEFGHNIDLLHTKINVPLETAAAWEQSAEVTGMSAERIASSLAMMDTRLAQDNKQALEAVNALGISFTELRDAAPDKQVQMLAEAMERFKESGGKADVIVKELMGRGGLGMLPELTPEAQKLQEEIAAINGPLEAQVAAAEKYEHAAALLSAHWEAIRRAIATPIVGGLASFFESAAGKAITQATLGGFGIPAGVSNLYSTPGTSASRGPVSPIEMTVTATQAEVTAAIRKAQEEQERDQAKHDHIMDLLEKARLQTMQQQAKEIKQVYDLNRVVVKQDLDEWAKDEADFNKALAASHAQVAKDEADFQRSYTEQVHREFQLRIMDLQQESAAYSDFARIFQQLGSVLGSGIAGTLVGGVGSVLSGLSARSQQEAENVRMYERVLKETDEATADAALAHAKLIQNIEKAASAAAAAIGIWKQYGHEMNAGSAMLGGAMQGAEAGAAFGPWGVAIGAVAGGLLGFFSGEGFRQIARTAGNVLGIEVSKSLAEAIEKTMKSDKVSIGLASLLHLGEAMDEGTKAGRDPASFMSQIETLMNAIALHSVPAREGLQQLGKAFTDLQAAAEAGSLASEQAMIVMIQQARQMGEITPEMQRYIEQQLSTIPKNLEIFFTALAGDERHPASEAQGLANQQIMAASFQALAAQEGIVKAAEALQKAMEQLMAGLPEGQALSPDLKDLAMIADLLKDARFRENADAAQAGADIMRSLLDTGNLNQATVDAFSTSAQTLMQEQINAAIEHGYDPDQARRAAEMANLPLLAQLQHAAELGAKLDPSAQAMLEQAQKDGILPLKTVSEQQLDELRRIREGVNALAHIGGGPTGTPGRGGQQPQPGPNGEPNPTGPYGEPEPAPSDTGTMPQFAEGGPVERTGVAYVHEGEYVIPRGEGMGPSMIVVNASMFPGSEALTQFILRKIDGNWIQVQ